MDFIGRFMQTGQAQFSGVGQQFSAQRVEKKEDQKLKEQTPQEQPKQEEVKDSYQRTQGSEQPKTHERKAEQVVRHFVSQTDANKEAKKTDQKKETQHTHHQHEAGENKPKTFTPLDNSARIGLMYQQEARKNKNSEGQKQVDYNATQAQQNKLKQFLGKMREFVKTEYQQYTRPDISPYSRRNLREILTALGDDTKAFDNKQAKDRRDRQTPVDGEKKYNQHFAARASRHHKLFTEDQLQDSNYSPFEMIA